MYTRYRKLRATDVLQFPEGVTPKQGASACHPRSERSPR